MNVVYDLEWASFSCSTGNILYIISNCNHCSTYLFLENRKKFSKISYSLLKIFFQYSFIIGMYFYKSGNYHFCACLLHLLKDGLCLKWAISSVAQSCPTPCDPMKCSTPGLPVHHQLPEVTQTHAHRVGDAIQPFHPLSSPSPPAPNPSQHHSLFQ